ncbi:MAG TPA: Holliday junction resolvase RuvX [Clostridiales bacterium]|nr:Holliday junction resolvase RuvX [Clostridiales bacterium]
MGVDFGGKRIGIAFSDLSGTIATAYEVYVSQNEEKDIDYLTSLAKKREVSKVVFGLPLNADGTESDQTRWTRDFATKFSEKSEIETDFEDERFSSLEAEELLKEAKMNWKQRKLILDKVAAEIILQNYLNKNKKG